MSKDVRMNIINKLGEFSDENGLKFIWAIERRPDGCLTVQFKPTDGRPLMYRITNSDILAANSDADVIAIGVIKKVKEWMKEGSK